jgi:prevent-host-death family protein
VTSFCHAWLALVHDGQVLEERREIGEVSVRELSRETSAVLRRARDFERIIVTRHGHPVAVVLSVAACIDLVVSEEHPMSAHRVRRARLKRELVNRLLGPELAHDASERRFRRMSRMLSPLPPSARRFHGQ